MVTRAAVFTALMLGSVSGGDGVPAKASLPRRLAAAERDSQWSHKLMPYRFESDVTAHERGIIRKAIDDMTTRLGRESCVRIVERTNESKFVTFRTRNAKGCRHSPASHLIQLGWECMTKKIIQHEIMHALGFIHTHARPDRDTHIRVNHGNIKEGYKHNFKRFQSKQVDVLGLPYDTESIMHYDSYSGLKGISGWGAIFGGRTTIDFLKKDAKRNDGNMSRLDVLSIQKFYRCPEISVSVPWHLDGSGKSGLCGKGNPLPDGNPAQCDPDHENHCCSAGGYCGSTAEHCTCDTCEDYSN